MACKPRVATHEDYLARQPADKRAALETLRSTIRAAAPSADECMSYGLPAFRLDGRVLVLFGATANRCSFYPGSGTAVEAYKGDLEGYSTSKGTIRFDPAKPLPAPLVRKIVKYRIAENAARQKHAAAGALRRR
ncbi:MAG: iron chaperone [Kiritimatiellia bacterium]